MQMTGVILAGGENRRIPLLKGHIEINGQRIIDSNIRLLKNFFDKVVISTNLPESYFYCGVPMVGDIIRQRGPLTGILSVLLNTGEDIFVIGCDMPFIKPELIKYMADKYKAENTERKIQNEIPLSHPSPSRGEGKGGGESLNAELKNWDAVIPIFEGNLQPLPGIYSRNILSVIEERLDKGLRGLREMLTELKVLYIKDEEVKAVDPEGRSFTNINTMEDYKKIVNSV